MSNTHLPMRTTDTPAVVLSGLVATLGLTVIDFSARMLVGLGLLSLYLGAVYVRNQKQMPAGGLMAAGFVMAMGLTIALGVVGALFALFFGKTLAEILVLAGLALAFAAMWAHVCRTRQVTPQIWLLLALVVVCQLLVRVKYFVLFGLSWSVAAQWLGLSAYAVLSASLLPLMLSVHWARRHGQLATLFVVGTTYIGFQLLTDIGHTVSLQLGDSVLLGLYKALVPLLFTVVAPLWFVLAKSARARLPGLVAIIGLAVVFDLVVVLAFGRYQPLIWLSAIPYTFSVLLTLVLGHQLCSASVRA